jgi:plastocyanin
VAAVLALFGLSACADDGNASGPNIVEVAEVPDPTAVPDPSSAAHASHPSAPEGEASADGGSSPTGSPASGGSAEPVAREGFEIEIATFQFSPAEAVVPAGTEVVWINNDTDVHSIISTGDLFAGSDVFDVGESYSVVFAEPGTYAYTCGVHPFMEGTIIVE